MPTQIQSTTAPKPTVGSNGKQIPAQRLSTSGVTSFAQFNSQTDHVSIDCQGVNCYVTFDGTVPSATNGSQWYAGNNYFLHTATAQNLKAIAQAGSGTLQGSEFQSINENTQLPDTSILKPAPSNTQTTGAGNFSSIIDTGTLAVSGTATMYGAVNVLSTLNVSQGAFIYNQGSANYSVTNALQIGSAPKATAQSGGSGTVEIVSNDAANQLQAQITLVTSPTAGNRQLQISCIEQGVAFRDVSLAPQGGNVLIGTSTDSGGGILQVGGNGVFIGSLTAGNSGTAATFTLGAGGTGAYATGIIVNGSTAGGGNGPYMQFQGNSVGQGYVGSQDAIIGGTTHNLVTASTNATNLYTNGSALALSLDASQNGVFSASVYGGSATVAAAPSATQAGFQFSDPLHVSAFKISAGAVSTLVPLVNFYNTNGLIGSISVSASATAYNTTSDGRLKQNVRDFGKSGLVIDRLRVRSFDWKGGGCGVGVIAQEAIKVFPDAVSRPKKRKDRWQVDYSKFVPLLLAEVKALRKRVKQLEAVHG